MRRKFIFIIIACVTVTLTTVSNAEQPYPSGNNFNAKVESLRLAIEDLIQNFGDDYPGGQAYLTRLRSIDEEDFTKLQREALIANPLVSGQLLLYVVRALDEVGTHTYLEPNVFRGYGAALKVIDLSSGQTRTIVETEDGIIRNPCVHFDGRRVLFSMSRSVDENFNIFEVDWKSPENLKQLTNASDVSDVDPIYMVDDSIVFASSRDLKYVPCDTMLVPQLFRMSADGSNVHQITRSTAHENQVSLMPDGRILYSRWDYVDRNFGDGHGFWVTNPDGTNQALIWGNNTTHPSAGWFARFIPGTGRLLCILGTHHDSLGGALAILDPRRAIEGKDSVVRTWPAEVKGRFQQNFVESLENEGNRAARLLVASWSPEARDLWKKDPNMRMHQHDDDLRDVRPWYNTPWPLSEKYFLCARASERYGSTAIYLIDVFGNELMLHKEEVSSFSPMPLTPSTRPISIPTRRDYGSGDGLFYIQDVYQGTHMKNVDRGTIKSVRVVEAISKRGLSDASWNGMGEQTPAVNWTEFNTKQVLGTVPVEEDGSAYFAVPSDRFVYFQLLDEKGMMVQSMRSGTSVHSGEKLSCVGCHESRSTSSPFSGRDSVTIASMRAPSKLQPWYGPSRPFSYQTEVQPVLDKHCVECHDFGKEGAKKIVLSGDRTASFNVSYAELWRKGFVGGIGAGPAGNLPPKSWGSNASPLIQLLRKGHKDVLLDDESMDRLITWTDLNGPYYPTSYSAYPQNMPGRSPLDGEELETLGKLVGFTIGELTEMGSFKSPMISFERPEMSPCLASLKKNSRKYRKALKLIREGKKRLKELPRADMPGFIPWEGDLERIAHRKKYNEIELNSRKAIREGNLSYEQDQEVYKHIGVQGK
jgi:hypothetical protein